MPAAIISVKQLIKIRIFFFKIMFSFSLNLDLRTLISTRWDTLLGFSKDLSVNYIAEFKKN